MRFELSLAPSSSGLGRCPLKAVTPVQIWSGLRQPSGLLGSCATRNCFRFLRRGVAVFCASPAVASLAAMHWPVQIRWSPVQIWSGLVQIRWSPVPLWWSVWSCGATPEERGAFPAFRRCERARSPHKPEGIPNPSLLPSLRGDTKDPNDRADGHPHRQAHQALRGG